MSCAKCNSGQQSENRQEEKAKKENFLKKIYDFLSSLKITIIGGVFLAASLILLLTKTSVPIDPAWAAVLLCGYPLLYNAIWSLIKNRGIYKITSALLISIAMIAAIYIDELFAAGQVAFIMAIGAVLEEKTIERARKGIKKLINLAPKQGRIIKNGSEEMIPVEQIKKDDVLRIFPGEAIPVDGEILSGNTSIDQSIITGESLPIDKSTCESFSRDLCVMRHHEAIVMVAVNIGSSRRCKLKNAS